MKIVLNGVQFGIVLAFLIGPVFFTIIQTSVEKGFWKGALVALGVSLSDISYVVICYFGLVHLFERPTFRVYLAYVGGGILILFGLYYLVIKRSRPEVKATVEKKGYRYVLKGFLINGFSPMVLVFWIGTISVSSLELGYTKGFEFFLFFAAMLLTVLATDLIKAYLADRLRRIVTPKTMSTIHAILGLVLVGFGIRLILQSHSF